MNAQPDVLLERRGAVALITLNRPESLNAMGGRLIATLREHVEAVAFDDSVRAVVLTGAGRGFCSGGDLRGKAEPPGPSALEGAQALHRIPFLLHTMLKPTIAAVNGPSAGAGMSLAMSCDMRIVARSAKFVTAFRLVGLSGDFGGSYFLQKAIGYSKALELYLTSEHIDAQRALGIGIANHVVDDDKLLDTALSFATWLSEGHGFPTARMKENFVVGAGADARTALHLESVNHRMSAVEAGTAVRESFAKGPQKPFDWGEGV